MSYSSQTLKRASLGVTYRVTTTLNRCTLTQVSQTIRQRGRIMNFHRPGSIVLGSLMLVLLALCGCSDRSTASSNENSNGAVRQETEKEPHAISRILESPSISPYEIQQFVNEQTGRQLVEFGPLWSKLRIPRDEEGIFDGFIASYSPWRAEVIDVSKSDDGGLREKNDLSILKIAAQGGSSRRYLIFRLVKDLPNSVWQFLGNIDILGNYEGNKDIDYQKIVRHEHNTFLIVRTVPRIGTGLSDTSEMWFKIDEDHPKKMLEYPINGASVVGNVSDVEYVATTILEPKARSGFLTQEVRYTVLFGATVKPAFKWLFSKSVRVVFVWDQAAQAFTLAPMSDISMAELNSRFGSERPSEFIRYNFDRLLKLVSGVTPEQRKWFDRVVNEMPDSREKSALVRALEN